MAVGDETRKSLTEDAATYHLSLDSVQAGGANQTLATWPTEKKPAAKPAAHRTVTAADAADISSATGYLAVGNSCQVSACVDLSVASSTASFFIGLYDAASDLIGVTDEYQFAASATYRDGAAGPYVSSRYIFDVSGATRVKAWCTAISSGTANIFLVPL